MQNRKRDTDVQNRFWTLWEKAKVGYSERIALKQVYYQGWNRSPDQVGCMTQVLRAGTLGRPRGMGWGGTWERRLGWETHVNPWLILVNVWQKPLQYCKVISLQLIKINEKIKKKSKLENKHNPEITNKLKNGLEEKTTLHFCHFPLWLGNIYQGESTDIWTQIRYRSQICKALWRIWYWCFKMLLQLLCEKRNGEAQG